MYKIMALLLLMLNQGFSIYLENDQKIDHLDHLRYLDDLLASGSEQFSDNQLSMLLNDIVQRRNIHPTKIVVIDLREESHFFADGTPFTAMDEPEHSSQEYVFSHELDIQKKLIAQGVIKLEPRQSKEAKNAAAKTKNNISEKQSSRPNKFIHLIDPIVKTEAEICKKYGVQYKRIPLTDHLPPDEASIQEFIKFVSSLPKDTWIHIHCRAGKGRTTTFLAILEMLRFKHHSLYDVLTRQHDIGGQDLLKIQEDVEGRKAAEDRLNIIKMTYDALH